MNIFFLSSENKNKHQYHCNWYINSKYVGYLGGYLCKYHKCLGHWPCLLNISYNIQKRNVEKISKCHFETMGLTLYRPKLEGVPCL